MTHWLYQQVLAVEDERAPQFALRSTQNWIRSLRFEIDAEHGADLPSQFASCLTRFKSTIQPLASTPPLKKVFEPLFNSLNFSLAGWTVATLPQPFGWLQPTSVVAWYYAVYMATRAIFAASGLQVKDTHAAAQRTFVSSVRQKLPHPLNMVATRTSGEDYDATLPTYPGISPYDLSKTFRPIGT